MGLRNFSLSDLIERNAELHGERLAFVCGNGRVSHRDHAVRVRRVAAGLVRAGVVPGDRVAIAAQNSIEFVELLGAVARLGAILVPLNWRLAPDELAWAIADTTPRIVIADEAFLPQLAGIRAQAGSIERSFSTGAGSAGFEPFDALTSASATVDAGAGTVLSSSPVIVIHTAAVTGRPRGAVLSQANLLTAGQQLIGAWNLSASDVHLGALPLFHIAGIGLTLATQLAAGATVLQAGFDAPVAAGTIGREKVTVMFSFAPMLGALLDAAADSGTDLSSLRNVGGLEDANTIARLERMCPNARFWASYGQTETSGIVCIAPYRDLPGSAGRPLALARIRIVDDVDSPLRTGQIGEIVVRGPTVFQGYWNRDADNDLTFRNGWHHTGDLGRVDDDGYLWYGGRSPAKELIKSGGENIYPGEVELALLEHDAIAEAVVFGVADAQWGEAVRAVCVCRPGHSVPAAELIEFVGSRIARFKRPKHVVFVTALPRSAQGQVDRQRIRNDFAGDPAEDESTAVRRAERR